MVIVICRSLLYRQFDRMVIVAIGFYGVIAYATRPTTPLLTALVNDALSWRWIFWVNVPLALLGDPLGASLHQARSTAPAAAAADRLDQRHLVCGVDGKPDLSSSVGTVNGAAGARTPSRRRLCSPWCCPSPWRPGSAPA